MKANNSTFIDLGLRLNGKKILFADRNIGAKNITDYGKHFAWADVAVRNKKKKPFNWRNCPHHKGDTWRGPFSKYNEVDGKNTLDSEDDIASILLGKDWRMPDKEELNLLQKSKNVKSKWVTNYQNSGINGLLVTGKGEFSSASLFLPAAGDCNGASLNSVGDDGNYWSRSLSDDYPDLAFFLNFYKNGRHLRNGNRFCGFSVRPVRVVAE